MTQDFWRKCSTCKKAIPFNAKYYECSVSTCTNPRTGYVFCSVQCWEAHVPGARHRDAAAIEKQAGAVPFNPESPKLAPASPQRRIVTSSQSPAKPQLPNDVLIVVSKLKDYIKARADMNTSDSVKDILSEHVRRLCDDAIDRARADGRKTVMDRDFEA